MLDGEPMSSPISKTFAPRVIALACAATLALAGCGPAASHAPGTAPSSPVAQPTSLPTTSAAPSASAAVRGTVRFALDWTPNTNHTGIYVAQAKGWYGDAGVDVEILPYGTTTPETLMTAGQADCGISFQDALTFAVAGGAPLVSVMAVLQFKAGAAPQPCPAAGDVNCSGSLTSADIIGLVSHVFKGGAAPCDVCTLIPGTWNCP